MSLRETLKHEANIEKEKFRQMSLSDKLWYIGEYYKFHIVMVLVVLILLQTIGSTIYRNIYYSTALHGFVINNRSDQGLNTAPFQEGFAGYMDFTGRQVLTVENSYISYGDEATEFSYATMAKLSALIAAKDLDFIIMDEASLRHFGEMGAFANLEEFLPDDILCTVQEAIILLSGNSGASRQSVLSLTGTAFAADSNLSPDCRYMAIVGNTTRGDTAAALIRYIFD